MSDDFHVIIPARYQSTRFPGKLLMELNGITVLERVYRQALLANPASVTIATDNQAIFDVAQGFGALVEMTSMHHQSGTDRIAEVVARRNLAPDAIIVNVQGDEPLINPALIKQVAASLNKTTASMATLCWPIENEAMRQNPNVVKVVRDKDEHALYFSRSAIPACRENENACKLTFRHIGLYAYRADFLVDIVNLPVCELEESEALEQLRVLWAGYKIKVELACTKPLQDINTLDDLQAARALVVNNE